MRWTVTLAAGRTQPAAQNRLRAQLPRLSGCLRGSPERPREKGGTGERGPALIFRKQQQRKWAGTWQMASMAETLDP